MLCMSAVSHHTSISWWWLGSDNSPSGGVRQLDCNGRNMLDHQSHSFYFQRSLFSHRRPIFNRQFLPVWLENPVTLHQSTSHRVLNFAGLRRDVRCARGAKEKSRLSAAILNPSLPLPPIINKFGLPAKCEFLIRSQIAGNFAHQF